MRQVRLHIISTIRRRFYVAAERTYQHHVKEVLCVA